MFHNYTAVEGGGSSIVSLDDGEKLTSAFGSDARKGIRIFVEKDKVPPASDSSEKNSK